MNQTMQVIIIGAPEFSQIIAEATANGYVKGREETKAEVVKDPDEIISFEQVAIEVYHARSPLMLSRYAKDNAVVTYQVPDNKKKYGIKRKDIPKLFLRG